MTNSDQSLSENVDFSLVAYDFSFAKQLYCFELVKKESDGICNKIKELNRSTPFLTGFTSKDFRVLDKTTLLFYCLCFLLAKVDLSFGLNDIVCVTNICAGCNR